MCIRDSPCPGPIGGLERAQERTEAVEVLAKVGFDQCGRSRLQLDRRVRQAPGDPAVSFAAADVSVEHFPRLLEGVHELGWERAPTCLLYTSRCV